MQCAYDGGEPTAKERERESGILENSMLSATCNCTVLTSSLPQAPLELLFLQWNVIFQFSVTELAADSIERRVFFCRSSNSKQAAVRIWTVQFTACNSPQALAYLLNRICSEYKRRAFEYAKLKGSKLALAYGCLPSASTFEHFTLQPLCSSRSSTRQAAGRWSDGPLFSSLLWFFSWERVCASWRAENVSMLQPVCLSVWD